mmetsp:Transcript_1088/g.3614  ORF Transcript_1088/g.3614 Transcript_1088/m.3614 type:complete len:205 (-) Transcript_1088:357-971(-)
MGEERKTRGGHEEGGGHRINLQPKRLEPTCLPTAFSACTHIRQGCSRSRMVLRGNIIHCREHPFSETFEIVEHLQRCPERGLVEPSQPVLEHCFGLSAHGSPDRADKLCFSINHLDTIKRPIHKERLSLDYRQRRLGEFRVWNLRTLGDWHPCSTRTLGRRAARACARSVDCLMQPLSQLQQPLHSAQQLRALLHLPAALNLVS